MREAMSSAEIADLRYWGEALEPLYGAIPPWRADRFLKKYLHNGWVVWVGTGYLLTQAGRDLVGIA